MFPGARTRGRYQERRDAGVPRSKANGDEGEGCLRTEAAFGRKRAAAVSEAVSASPAKRARMNAEMPWLQPGVGWDCIGSVAPGVRSGPPLDGTGERFLRTSCGLCLGIPQFWKDFPHQEQPNS